MSYCTTNFKTKKALKQALTDGQQLACFNPGLGGPLTNFTGTVYLEGPHYPAPHSWYAVAQLVNGIIVKIK